MAAEEAKPWLHELTAADLYAHCRIADERRAIDVTASYSAWLPYTGRPPREASNEALDALKPLYVELLRAPALSLAYRLQHQVLSSAYFPSIGEPRWGLTSQMNRKCLEEESD